MATAEQLTVQVLPDARKDGAASTNILSFATTGRQSLLAAYGTRQRLVDQRNLYHHPANTLFRGAVQGIVKKIVGTPWEINGGKTRATYYSNVFREAQFGKGWGDFLTPPLIDYLTLDIGGFIEVIAPGSPKRAPTGRVVGLAYLDALRCYPTGDPEFPVIYYSRKGEMHLLHHTRVIQLVDMPTSDENYQGWGESAESRAEAIIERQLYMARYIRTKLDDLPPPGIVVGSNLNRSELDRSIQVFMTEQQQDTLQPYGRTMWLFGTNPQETAELNVTTFNQPPEGWDYPKYMDIDVNQLALAMGLDKQELWELNGVNVGSATQSVILDAKSKGKFYGNTLTKLERELNRLLPDDLDYEFKVKDSQEEIKSAEIAQTWVGVGKSLQEMGVPSEIWLRILANQVRGIADAAIDIDGELIRINDQDTSSPQLPAGTPSTVTENTQNDLINANPGSTQDQRTKDIGTTREAFEDAFTFVLENARKDVYGKVRLRSILMNLIREYGYKAYADGKQEGGVDEPLTDAEEAEALTLLAGQREYVRGFVDAVVDVGITDATASGKAQMWYTKSIQPFLYAGRTSADADGLYEFGGKDGMESCETCQRLKGQRHRLRQWTTARLRPGVDTDRFECKGFRCQHTLTRTKGKPRGRLTGAKELIHVDSHA